MSLPLLRVVSTPAGAGDESSRDPAVAPPGCKHVVIDACAGWAELQVALHAAVVAALDGRPAGQGDAFSALRALVGADTVILVRALPAVGAAAAPHVHRLFETAVRALSHGDGKHSLTIVLEGWAEAQVLAPTMGVAAAVRPFRSSQPAAPVAAAPQPTPAVAAALPVAAAAVATARAETSASSGTWADDVEADGAHSAPPPAPPARAPTAPPVTPAPQPPTAAPPRQAAPPEPTPAVPSAAALEAQARADEAAAAALMDDAHDPDLAAATAASAEEDSWVTVDTKKSRRTKGAGGEGGTGVGAGASGGAGSGGAGGGSSVSPPVARGGGGRPAERDDRRGGREPRAAGDANGRRDGGRPPSERRDDRRAARADDGGRRNGVGGPAGREGGGRGPPSAPLVITPGPVPDDLGAFEDGMIFGCKKETSGENERRGLLGLPVHHIKTVERIQPGRTALFVFHYNSRELHALYAPTCKGGLNIEKDAYVEIAKKLSHKHGSVQPPHPEGGSPFPAQVRYRTVFQFTPLQEWQWQHVVEYQKFTHHFKFWLEKAQVEQLLALFRQNHGKPQPPRPVRRDDERRSQPQADGQRSAADAKGGAVGGTEQPAAPKPAAAAAAEASS